MPVRESGEDKLDVVQREGDLLRADVEERQQPDERGDGEGEEPVFRGGLHERVN